MACSLFGFSGINVPVEKIRFSITTIIILRMLPRILDVPRRNFHGMFSVELHSWLGRSDADAWSESTEGEE